MESTPLILIIPSAPKISKTILSAKSTLPPFEALPVDKSGPAGNAWGLYGAEDELGSLKLLTPETVVNAAKLEIETGERFSLDWRLDRSCHAKCERQNFK